MDNENNGNSKPEKGFSRFVVKHRHCQKCADASAHKGKRKQCSFGNAPLMVHGLDFVRYEDKKRNEIDTEKIILYVFVHKNIPLFVLEYLLFVKTET